MSGGHFDYDQYKIGRIADDIEQFFFGDQLYSDETMLEFRKAIHALRVAETYAQRIDWLVCGDDGEDTFHLRLKQDLERIK